MDGRDARVLYLCDGGCGGPGQLFPEGRDVAEAGNPAAADAAPDRNRGSRGRGWGRSGEAGPPRLSFALIADEEPVKKFLTIKLGRWLTGLPIFARKYF